MALVLIGLLWLMYGGLVMGELSRLMLLVLGLLVLRHVRTFCHSQLISSSVGVRSRRMSSLASLDCDWLGCWVLAADWLGCGVLAADWLGCGGLKDVWWASVGWAESWWVE